ncbi:MAG: hypothetical protein WKG07_17600 [Hymenobacter sp.]
MADNLASPAAGRRGRRSPPLPDAPDQRPGPERRTVPKAQGRPSSWFTGKQPIYTRTWFLIGAVLLLIGLIIWRRPLLPLRQRPRDDR